MRLHPAAPHDWIAFDNVLGDDFECRRCGAHSWTAAPDSACAAVETAE